MTFGWTIIGGLFVALFLGYGGPALQGHVTLLAGAVGCLLIALRSLARYGLAAVGPVPTTAA
jgi:hypothetical protein